MIRRKWKFKPHESSIWKKDNKRQFTRHFYSNLRVSRTNIREFTKPWRQRRLQCEVAFVSELKIQKIPCFSLDLLEFAWICFPWETLKLSSSISQLGNHISGVLYYRSRLAKQNSVVLNVCLQSKNIVFRHLWVIRCLILAFWMIY